MKAAEIRRKFLEFFKQKQHAYVHSAPVVVKNDPTLMFTNAGMNQFKDIFLGNKAADFKRVANSQKCLRVSGKHNDLEEVGIDTYHHTLFEMLGNWSFGDYFKKDSINWAWELLTEVYGLPKDRLYVTIFEGDPAENLDRDVEAYELWRQHVSPERILNGNKKDNFWEMGDTGPCGPCSEIHIDLRSEEEIALKPGRDLVNQSDPRVVEIWNLVFIQYNRMANKSLQLLPEKHVDTGMGFERLAMAIQGKQSNYDTDVFQPTIQFIAEKAGLRYGDNEKTDIAMRVIADHIRAISFAIADGQLPSNNKAGYVIRRILRRAVRYGYSFLNFKEPFLHGIVPILAEQMGDFFPEIVEQQAFVQKVIEKEEETFLKTLENGLRLFEELKATASNGIVDGKKAFELFDTFGFPKDLTALIARENNLQLDEAAFDAAMNEQKERSRAASASEKGDWVHVNEGDEVEFVGYEHLSCPTKLLRYREVVEKKGNYFQLVLERTPFYPEGGGQVGDIGTLDFAGEKIAVKNTQKENDLIIHIVDKLPKNLAADVQCQVDENRRSLTENNHSATHLLHAALKKVLGTHVNQKGSLVNEKMLRFDFSHFEKVSDEQLAEIEQIVNAKIRENIKLDEKRNVPVKEAMNMGAMALFGEKYGDFVRVISFDPNYSVELCGGTHVKSTAKIGLFTFVSESSVAAGVRRVEAITAEAAQAHLKQELAQLAQVRELMKNPKDLAKAVEGLLEERNKLAKDLELLQHKELQQLKNELLTKVKLKDGVSFIAEKVVLPNADSLRQLAFDLRNKVDNLFLVLAAEIENKPQIGVMISDNLVSDKGWHAGNIVKDLAKNIKGGGGGQAFFATAGGSDASGLANVITSAEKLV